MFDGDVLDLSGMVLDDADFSKCWFTASFRDSSLIGAKFRNSNVKSCDFSGANLTNADFIDAAMEAATWCDANLLNTKFGKVSLYGKIISEAKFLDLIKSECHK